MRFAVYLRFYDSIVILSVFVQAICSVKRYFREIVIIKVIDMKSKSFDSASSSTVKRELDDNNSFDFIRLYKTADETKASLQKYKNNADKDKSDVTKTPTPKRERSPNKRKKNKTAVEVSLINIEGPTMEASGAGCNTPLNVSKVTSTPLAHKEKVKSIMKTGTTTGDDAMNGSIQEVVSASKSKKRNKSVSFMLDDNDELTIKKTKSDDIETQPTSSKTNIQTKIKVNKKKKLKKDGQAEKENKLNRDNKVGNEHVEEKERQKKRNDKKLLAEQPMEGTSDICSSQTDTTPQEQIKKKRNKAKKFKKPNEIESEQKTNQNAEKKQAKKKKHEPKSQADTEEEPASKSRKKEIKPELIAEDLENLSIGDNAHTLSSMLDEMTVTDKEKRKKLKKKASKTKNAKNKEVPETQNTEETRKEKKWNRKRWNKDRKAKEAMEALAAAVVVDNLPISMLFSYKKTLAEHFGKYGLLRNVGIAEVYPAEVSKPVFTTTVYFDTEDAATKALAENGSTIEDSRITVSRPLPATQTTAVVRSYGALTEQVITTAFAGAGLGRIRSIRISAKGKNSMSSAFIEFDGPEAVERAIKMEPDIKIGKKKVHIARFELRTTRKEKSGDVASDADHSDNNDTQN